MSPEKRRAKSVSSDEKRVGESKVTYCFDLDGTLCSLTEGDYERALPLLNRIRFVNQLFDDGNLIKIFTARGATSGRNWEVVTKSQLDSWGIKHHQLLFGKPHADVFVDDKAVNSETFPWGTSNEFL